MLPFQSISSRSEVGDNSKIVIVEKEQSVTSTVVEKEIHTMSCQTDLIESTFSFKGTCTEDSLPYLKDNQIGDTWVVADTKEVFTWTGANWFCIDVEDEKSASSPQGKIRTSCKYCGAPLRVYNNPGYSDVVKCEYCSKTNSSWVFTVDPDFKYA